MSQVSPLTGAQRCARYAFAPNFYHYCGPDKNQELRDYLASGETEEPLYKNLAQFETLYPYLVAISEANGIADPFDPRVVEAYWLGNPLLERVYEQATFMTLTEKQHLKKRLPKAELRWLLPKIDKGARLHHSFHVFNVFTRTGHHTVKHTVNSIDKCIIGWGRVIQNNKEALVVESQQLKYIDGVLQFIKQNREIIPSVESVQREIGTGDWVSFHWNILCERISKKQAHELARYTYHHLALANATI